MGSVCLVDTVVPLPVPRPLERDLVSRAPWVQEQVSRWLAELMRDGIVSASVATSQCVLPGGAGRTYEVFLYSATETVGIITAEFVGDELKLTYRAIE